MVSGKITAITVGVKQNPLTVSKLFRNVPIVNCYKNSRIRVVTSKRNLRAIASYNAYT